MKCRHCGTQLSLPLIDLGTAPPSNAYLTSQQLHAPEKWFPLRVLVCEACWLVQTEDFVGVDELFTDDYAYFSSTSSSWLTHVQQYVSQTVSRFGLGAQSLVVELAANDGYLLQYINARGIPCVGVEPTARTAAAAREKGIEIVQEFFGEKLATRLKGQGRCADLIVANNVLAHVPDMNDFLSGISGLLKLNGVATFEFPHVVRLIEGIQFDTIYHEHFSYLSLTAVKTICERNGLAVFDVEELPTHGGSLRVYTQRLPGGRHAQTSMVDQLLGMERTIGVCSARYYAGFQDRAVGVKNNFLEFLLSAKRENKKVVGYGAAAKGNTLLNFAGVSQDLLPYIADRNLAKQGKFTPGSRIPIVQEGRIQEERPAYVVILPWNLRAEVEGQLSYLRAYGGRFVTAVPCLSVTDLLPIDR